MNKIAWNITFEWKIDFKIEDLYFLETQNLDWTYNYFLYWKTYLQTSEEVIKKLESIAWILSIDYDISISSEDNLHVFLDKPITWVYTITSIEWNNETFTSVSEKFSQSSPFIVSIREAEVSKKFPCRIIKIDIVN